MTKEQYRSCRGLSSVIADLIHDKTLPESFVNGLRALIPDLAEEILSTSINFDCPCKAKISAHAFVYPNIWADYIFQYGLDNNLKDKFDVLIANSVNELDNRPSLSGKIASTSVKEWEEFVKQIYNDGYQFYNFSVVKEGDKLLVFFM